MQAALSFVYVTWSWKQKRPVRVFSLLSVNHWNLQNRSLVCLGRGDLDGDTYDPNLSIAAGLAAAATSLESFSLLARVLWRDVKGQSKSPPRGAEWTPSIIQPLQTALSTESLVALNMSTEREA